MQVWKRRVLVVVAGGIGSAGLLMSSAGAQTTPPTSAPTFTTPTFTIPEFPEFPTFPPPPTMPPPTSSTTSPPPTMPPSSSSTSTPPPTMPLTTITIPPATEQLIESALARVEEFGDEFSGLIEEIRGLLNAF